MEGRDIYEYLTNFASDEDILNMLSVNKKFDDPKFFQRILEKRYPFLLKYKPDDLSWRRFFVAMIYWISKMRETFPDVSTDMFDPELVKGSEMGRWAKLFAFRTKILNFIEFFYGRELLFGSKFGGFESPVFLKQPMIDFIKNMDLGVPGIKEFLVPLLEVGVLNRAILIKLFTMHLSQNFHVIGKKYFIAPDMQHYIEEYLTEQADLAKSDAERIDNRGNVIPRFHRDKFVFNLISNIIAKGVVLSSDLTNEQKKILNSDYVRVYLSVLLKTLLPF